MKKVASRRSPAQQAEWNRLKEIGRGNVERNAEWPEDATPDVIHEEVFTLAFDAIHDTGADPRLCTDIATELAMEHANP